jgi:hypothetical protein
MNEHSPAHILRWLLLLNTPALVGDENSSEWPSYVNILPSVDNAKSLVFYNSDFSVQGRLHRGPIIEKPYWQIVARTLQYGDGYGKLLALSRFFDELVRPNAPVTISIPSYGNVKVSSVSRTTGILDMGQITQDSKKRFMLSLNGIIRYEKLED